MVAISFGVFSGAVVLDGGGEEAVVGAGGVEDLAEVRPPAEEVFGGAIVDRFLYFFDVHEVVAVGLP